MKMILISSIHLQKENSDTNTNLHHHGTINIVNVYCQERYLVLKNIDIKNSAEPLMPSDVNCDVACLVYDSSHSKSFEYVAKVYLVIIRIKIFICQKKVKRC